MKYHDIISGKICWYCECPTELVSDKEIYGPDSTYGGKYYRCLKDADHYVGTYSDNETSLGRVANKQLRVWKRNGHNAFDPLWKSKERKFLSQKLAYQWLSEVMGLDISLTHFGMFTEEQCREAINHCKTLAKT